MRIFVAKRVINFFPKGGIKYQKILKNMKGTGYRNMLNVSNQRNIRINSTKRMAKQGLKDVKRCG